MTNVSSTAARPLAVVTGASTGIGYHLARELASHGYDLVIAADGADIRTVAAELETMGTAAEAVQTDLAKPSGVEELFRATQMAGRPVDVVVINAGVGVYGDFARETSLEEHLNLIDLNVRSAVHLAKRISADMAARRHGRILFTSSIAATAPGPLMSTYNASKAFLLSFSEAIRNELADVGVTVTALMPGPTDTEFFRRAGMEDTKLGKGDKDDPAEVARQAYRALMDGDDKVIAGSFKNKLQGGLASHILPETVKAQMHRKQAEREPAAC